MDNAQREAIARDYIDSVGRGELDHVAELLSPTLTFTTQNGGGEGRGAWLAALRGFLPGLERNEIRHVAVSGDSVVVVYDFVTDSPAGAVLCVEWLTVCNGVIDSIHLLFDGGTFPLFLKALAERAGA